MHLQWVCTCTRHQSNCLATAWLLSCWHALLACTACCMMEVESSLQCSRTPRACPASPGATKTCTWLSLVPTATYTPGWPSRCATATSIVHWGKRPRSLSPRSTSVPPQLSSPATCKAASVSGISPQRTGMPSVEEASAASTRAWRPPCRTSSTPCLDAALAMPCSRSPWHSTVWQSSSAPVQVEYTYTWEPAPAAAPQPNHACSPVGLVTRPATRAGHTCQEQRLGGGPSMGGGQAARVQRVHVPPKARVLQQHRKDMLRVFAQVSVLRPCTFCLRQLNRLIRVLEGLFVDLLGLLHQCMTAGAKFSFAGIQHEAQGRNS
jgi:hypothetical protein